jgi:glucose/mannose-6-phosphate isomerase
VIDLSDQAALKAADPQGMLADVLASADQLEAARAQSLQTRSSLPTQASRIVYLGMGGSGIAGDALKALAATSANVPVEVVKDYTLPAFASGSETLVIACSYSGNTEETLEGFEQARKRGCTIVSITGGGELAKISNDAGVPVLPAPGGIQPRAAFPSLLAATLTVAETAGVIDPLDSDFATAVDALRESCNDAQPSNNGGFPNELATRWHGKHVHIWGMNDLAGVVASRMRAQIQENAKAPASNANLPELDHNEIMGYDPGEKTLESTCLTVLRHDFEHPRVALRAEITLELIRERIADAVMIRTHAPGMLATMLDLIVTGDLASVYLALHRGVDPSPVPRIQMLKERLANA